MAIQIFEYGFDKAFKGDAPFEETIDYTLTVPCVNRDETLSYIFRSYRFGEYLYITDIFPKIFGNDNRCFRRFTSHEGFTVNMRRLSVTCLVIFVEHFMSEDVRRAMVISGSYEDNEPPHGPSRKLRLYNYFFSPLLDEFKLRSVEMIDENAFILVSRDNPLTDEEIKQNYLDFKATRK